MASRPAPGSRTAKATKTPTLVGVDAVLAVLRKKASRKNVRGMARFGITSKEVWGITVAELHAIAKQAGRDHALAAALWKTGVYEARMLACFVEEPAKVTAAQMDRWTRAFDNWAICDTACMHLFDRTPFAYDKIAQWAEDDREFVRRAAFALIASLAGHDKTTGDDAFVACLPRIERAATDERNFVKKGVSWALRGLGQRNRALHTRALALATKLSTSASPSARWIGKDALRDLQSPAARARIARRSGKG